MDIKGVKPVASRVKQRPLGAKTKLHFSGRSAPMSVYGAKKSHTTTAPLLSRTSTGASILQAAPQSPQASVTARPPGAVPAPDAQQKIYPILQYEAPTRPMRVSQSKQRKGRRGQKLVLRFMLTCLVLVTVSGGLFAWNTYIKLHKVFHGQSVVAALAPKAEAAGVLNGQSDGRINVLLVGVSGDGGTAADLTDTVSLLSIDPVNNKASLLSIPTDLWVQNPISLTRQQELNAVYSTVKTNHIYPSDSTAYNPGAIEAGLLGLDQTIEQVTGVNINYHMLVNFQAFKQAVDAAGGVTINSPAKLYDPSLGYKNHVSPVLATAGSQQMDGEQALLYVRSRVTTDNSSQGSRELQVLSALKDKAFSADTLSSPTKIEALVNSLGDNVYSDLTTENAGQLYDLFNKVGDENITSVNLTEPSLNLFTTKQIGGLSLAIPGAGFNEYAAIQEYVRGYMSNGYLTSENAPVAVISGDASGAAITQNMLKSYGFDVASVTTTTQHVSHLLLVNLAGGKDLNTLQQLEAHYSTKAVTQMPAGITVPPGSAKFVIIEP